MKKYLIFFSLVLVAYFYGFKNRPAELVHWMDRVVAKEFKKFEKSGISKELIETTWRNCQRIKEFQRYKIIDSKVYGPATRVKSFLEVLVQKYPVPDVDFIYFYEDRLKKSFFKRSKHKKSAPIFVSAKEKGMDSVVLFCDWNYDIKDAQGGWNGLIEKVNQNNTPWSTKIDKLFWRGMPWDGKHFGMYDFDNWTSIPRGNLVYQSQKFPEWIDAAFSEYPARMLKKDPSRCCLELGKIEFVSWPDVFRYKYQIALDGVTSSFPATQWKLLSGCLVFKQETENIQYFYGELIPWKHYIPVKKDLTDLMEKLEWARKNDSQAQQIAQNAREFARENLMPEQILLYCYKVLTKYAELQKFQVTEL